MLVAAFLYQPSPMLLLIGLIATPHLLAAWRYDPAAPANAAYYGRIPTATKFEYTVLYLALAALLGIMTHRLHEMLAGVHGGA